MTCLQSPINVEVYLVNMIKRVIKFDKQDWKHISFLLKNCIMQCFNLNFTNAKDALYWVKIHICYDSNKVK